jgi:hypothetical protein
MATRAREGGLAMTVQTRAAIRERPPVGFRMPAAVSVVSCDIPEGMTLAQYGRERAAKRHRAGRLRRSLRS